MSVHWDPMKAKRLTLGPVPTVITYGAAHARCPKCGFRVRGDNHENGAHCKQGSASPAARRTSTGR